MVTTKRIFQQFRWIVKKQVVGRLQRVILQHAIEAMPPTSDTGGRFGASGLLNPRHDASVGLDLITAPIFRETPGLPTDRRSEERRVGKECRDQMRRYR